MDASFFFKFKFKASSLVEELQVLLFCDGHLPDPPLGFPDAAGCSPHTQMPHFCPRSPTAPTVGQVSHHFRSRGADLTLLLLLLWKPAPPHYLSGGGPFLPRCCPGFSGCFHLSQGPWPQPPQEGTQRTPPEFTDKLHPKQYGHVHIENRALVSCLCGGGWSPAPHLLGPG